MTYTMLRRTLRAVLSSAAAAHAGDFALDPAYEADEILRILCGADRAFLLLNGGSDAPEALCAACTDAAARRADGTPLAYVLGVSPFCGDDYFCATGCLIPRADTELLAEEAIACLPEHGVLWDLCTGTGCVPCAVLRGLLRKDPRSRARAWGVELYDVPLSLARKNGAALGLEERFFPVRGDVLAGDVPAGAPVPDVITANPPYISAAVCETLDSQVRREPLTALCGGEDGLDFYRAILARYTPKPSGTVLFEIGYDQGDALRRLAAAHGYACTVRQDFAGHDRVAVLQREPS